MVAVMEVEDPLLDLSSSISVNPLHSYNITESSSDEHSDHNRPSIQITRITSNGKPANALLNVHNIPSFVDMRSGNGYSNDHGMSQSQLNGPKKRGRKKGSKNKFKRGIPIELWNKFAESGMILSKAAAPAAALPVPKNIALLTQNNVTISLAQQNYVPTYKMQKNIIPFPMPKHDIEILPIPDDDIEISAIPQHRIELSAISQPHIDVTPIPNSESPGEYRLKRKYTKRPKIDISTINHKLQDKVEITKIDDTNDNNIILELDPACFYPDEPDHWKQFRKKRLEKIRNKPLSCEICYKGFKHIKGLQLHKVSKHGVEDLSGAYPCECCEQVFWMKRELREHLMIHRDEDGRLPCPEKCGATEPEPAGLVRHKQRYHPYLGTLGRNWFHTWGDR